MNISNSRTALAEIVWEYDINTQNWDKIILSNPRTLGAPRGHSSIYWSGRLLIFGGIVLFKKFTNDFYAIDLVNKNIEDISYNGEPPKPVAFHSMSMINDNCFLIYGGLNQNFNVVNSCKIFNLNTYEFISLEIPLLPKIFGHKLVFDEESKLYIIGGMTDFKYVGDESVIKKDDADNNDIFSVIEDQIQFQPMTDIFEIELNIQQ